MITSALAAVTGVIQVARFSSVDALRGEGMELQAVAVTVIGGTLLSGGYGSVIGTILGAITFGMIQVGLVLAGAPGHFFKTLTGADRGRRGDPQHRRGAAAWRARSRSPASGGAARRPTRRSSAAMTRPRRRRPIAGDEPASVPRGASDDQRTPQPAPAQGPASGRQRLRRVPPRAAHDRADPARRRAGDGGGQHLQGLRRHHRAGRRVAQGLCRPHPRAPRRQRRRQVDADQDPLRRLPARPGRAALPRRAGRLRQPRARRARAASPRCSRISPSASSCR